MARRARYFSGELQRYALIGLNAYRQPVGNKPFRFGRFVEHMRDAFKLDCHLCTAFGQCFACADVKGNFRPAPVLDEQFESHIRLSL